MTCTMTYECAHEARGDRACACMGHLLSPIQLCVCFVLYKGAVQVQVPPGLCVCDGTRERARLGGGHEDAHDGRGEAVLHLRVRDRQRARVVGTALLPTSGQARHDETYTDVAWVDSIMVCESYY